MLDPQKADYPLSLEDFTQSEYEDFLWEIFRVEHGVTDKQAQLATARDLTLEDQIEEGQ